MFGLSGKTPKLSGDAWRSIIIRSSTLTALIVTISVIISMAIMMITEGQLDPSGVATATFMPLLLVPPFAVVVGIKKQELKAQNRDLLRLAYTDTMLECMNRRGFIVASDVALKSASPKHPCALLVVDADNFKAINDTFGHTTGDKALEVITNAIKSSIRSDDIVGRVGGEEFAVILPGIEEKEARGIATRICRAVASTRFVPGDTPYDLTVSVGGAVATRSTNFLPLYDAADKQLYVAKEAGRNRSEFEPVARGTSNQKKRRTDTAA